ncbi:NAD(P)/FAD-dependent oxidoreductase [Pseudooceanicola algae]|uniref:D-amino acid dehydrogenase 1 n=1 Tax=Pseudooceanicola algae TaxID=1537215 RepID=A0A418SHG9_9RHOB|nr:FAD-binding oxidoreductase [Pseudooceanicola algae]QPM90347.1 D-amino acid dehydrogenase 1 [Pseudooceanicola algae]
MQVAVIGAGVIGVSCALSLRARGADVVIYDNDGPAAGASRRNAGIFATYAVVPEFTPGLLRRVPEMLLNPQGALSLRLGHLPRLLPWGLRALRAARPARVAEVTEALSALLHRVTPDSEVMLSGAAALDLRRKSGALHIFHNTTARSAKDAEWDEMARRGIPFEPLDQAEIAALEPAIAAEYAAGYHLTDVYQAVDPEQIVRRLFAHYLREGGRFEPGHVRSVDTAGTAAGARLRFGDGGERRHDAVVIAAGVHSTALARGLDLRLPLEAERGYNTTLPAPGLVLNRPVCVVDSGYYMSPMNKGLRIGGKVELAGLKAAPRWSRANVMVEHARGVLPGLNPEAGKRWMGLRPSTPDSLPVIGPVPGHPAVMLACGHGHLGLTLAAPTGELVAQLLSGEPTDVDPAPYSATRFTR